ncbi:MAG: ATP-dependent DNA helicase RecG [Bacteroidia bacterium]|nr:ATP-dependent DNA helicase RecG [Bacteroidia bacterium]
MPALTENKYLRTTAQDPIRLPFMNDRVWQKDIMYLKRVGPQRADALRKFCNIHTYLDLAHYFPRKYVDRSQVSKISQLSGDGQQVVLVGKITHIQLQTTRNGKSLLTASFTDGSGILELTWFQGVKYLQKSLKPGQELAIFGAPARYNGMLQISHPEMDPQRDEDGPRRTLQIVPFYPSTEALGRMGLDSQGFRALLHQLLDETRGLMPESLSDGIRQRCRLVSREEAIQHIHFPPSPEHLFAAQRRLKFEELFFFQLMLARRKSAAKSEHRAHPFTRIGPLFNTFFEQHMPFELTGAQKRVLKEIRRDLGRPVQMNRLVQGDVGSGKTMVAFMTMLMARDNGFQSMLMAPTAILAEQHYAKLAPMAEKIGLKTVLLVGGQRKKVRDEALDALASGEADLAIGTHALIEDSVRFQRLGLVIVDEQHKFGVLQRARLWQKADPYPHNLVMTATPIPRTLAMTLYGDVDVSVIDELPPGRKEIRTRVFRESKRLELFGFIRRELEQGRQAYVVYPLVEESEKVDLLAAEKGHELLERHFQGFRVGLVHGRMDSEAKDLEMQRFIRRQTHILVSTTVIEVGVDVPNASIMVVENAERFGLSQLHQLRGRVGRGSAQSYCILMAGAKLSNEGRRRLAAMEETNDGFRIAEIDLELRGPGDFLGTRQSGVPEFRLADIVEDQELLQEAREAAFHLIETDPELAHPAHADMVRQYRAYIQAHASLGAVA